MCYHFSLKIVLKTIKTISDYLFLRKMLEIYLKIILDLNVNHHFYYKHEFTLEKLLVIQSTMLF